MDENFWRNAPKSYCDNANMATVAGLGDMFLLALLSGGQAQMFAFTPEHVKRMHQMISFKIKEYEDAHGKIKVDDWTVETKSPFQVKDIDKSK